MTARQCAIYVRISSDPSGKGLGVARQETACRKRADELGWEVRSVFTDNDVSASTGKRRPAYQDMLDALERSSVDAVVVWDLDRLTRRPIEIEQFIDLADRKRIALASVGGDVDLSTDNGRMFARIKGAVARAEVERKSARQKAANDQRAESGAPFMGRRAFGYAPSAREVVLAEAAEFKGAVDALLRGESLRSIVRGMTERGVTTTAGNPWKPTELRRLLANPRHAGLRVHRGEIVGRGDWPAIIDEDTHRAVVAILSDPARKKAGAPRRYLLTGIATCGVCGGSIYGVTESRGPLYYCETRSHVARRAEAIDELVEGVMVGLLQRPDSMEWFARSGNETEATELRDEEHRLRAKLDALAEAFAADDIDAAALRAGSRRLRSALDANGERLAGLLRAPDLQDVLHSTHVANAWHSLDVDRKRSALEAVMSVTIRPAGRGARVFDPQTVDIMPRMLS